MSAFNTLPPAVALGQIVAYPEGTLDGVLLRWLEAHWGKVEIPGLRTRRYSEALAEALRVVDLLGLSACRHWLREHAPAGYRWLAVLQVGSPATPLDALFATLATVQPDRALEPLWLRLSRLLVRCFERLSRTVRDLDPGLARDLAHEALRLEPSNHNNWATLGLALDAVSDWTRARAVFWHARRRFPHDPFAHTQLGQTLLRHGEDDAALIAYAEAVRRFPHDPVATLGYGHALYELEGPDAALPDPKLDQLAERLDLAKAGRLQEFSLHRRDPVVGPAGNPDALSDIAGSGLAYAAALGESTLFRHAGELERADQAIRRLPAGPERDAEQGLWIAIHDSWGAAADWWRDRNTYETVTRIHALRSRQQSGEAVDWTPLTRNLPQYSPIIRSLARQDLPELSIIEDDPEDLKRDAWLYGEAASDPVRRDEAQEDWPGWRRPRLSEPVDI